MSTKHPVADGSSIHDTQPPVLIDRSNPVERYRWVCPNGHTRWDRTNNHVWCKSCREQVEAGRDVDPEHWQLLDKKTDELVDWARITLAEDF